MQILFLMTACRGWPQTTWKGQSQVAVFLCDVAYIYIYICIYTHICICIFIPNMYPITMIRYRLETQAQVARMKE